MPPSTATSTCKKGLASPAPSSFLESSSLPRFPSSSGSRVTLRAGRLRREGLRDALRRSAGVGTGSVPCACWSATLFGNTGTLLPPVDSFGPLVCTAASDWAGGREETSEAEAEAGACPTSDASRACKSRLKCGTRVTSADDQAAVTHGGSLKMRADMHACTYARVYTCSRWYVHQRTTSTHASTNVRRHANLCKQTTQKDAKTHLVVRSP